MRTLVHIHTPRSASSQDPAHHHLASVSSTCLLVRSVTQDTQRTEPFDWEYFTIMPLDGGKIALQSHHGGYLGR